MNMATVDRSFDRRTAAAEAPRLGESHVRSLSDLQSLLSRTYAGLRAVNEGPAVAPMVDDLVNGLADLRAHSTTDAWKSIVERLRKHPVLELMHQDPYTHRGYHKPRGYAADAVMLDFIYRHPSGEPLRRGATPLGEWIYNYTTASALAEAMRNRRDLIAKEIENVVKDAPGGAEILGLECGHLREAAHCQAIANRAQRRFVALDRDGYAVATVEKEWGHLGLTAIHTPTYALLTGAPNALGEFDLIYSNGIFNGFEMRQAVRAIGALFAMLKPGGKLWLANLFPGIRDAGYIEAFMNWWPVYRDYAAMTTLLTEIPRDQILSYKTSLEPHENIVLLEVSRR